MTSRLLQAVPGPRNVVSSKEPAGDPMIELTIRPSRVEDVPLILQLIRELAEFENLAHQVLATEDSLGEALFGSRRVAEALVGLRLNEIVAYAIFFDTFSTFLGKPGLYLEDLYVKPTHRGRGVGRALLREVASIAIDRGCGRLEWSVLDWNERALSFYRELGAEPVSGWTVHRLSGTGLIQLSR